MISTVNEYDLFHIFNIPREIKYLESVILVVLFFSNIRQGVQANLLISIYLLVSLASILFNGLQSDFVRCLQVIYLGLSQIVGFYILMNVDYRIKLERVLSLLLSCLFALFLINFLAGWYQVAQGWSDDNVRGFMSEAHTFANFMLLSSVFMLGYKKHGE